MENINFIPATELPEAEGDEVSVLCVENGELKQKAASGLGGGGSGSGSTNYDLAVRFNLSYDPDEGNVYVDCEILSGSYDAVVQKLDEGVAPNVLAVESGIMWDGQIKSVYENNNSGLWLNIDGRERLYIEGRYGGYFLYPNGTAEYD